MYVEFVARQSKDRGSLQEQSSDSMDRSEALRCRSVESVENGDTGYAKSDGERIQLSLVRIQ